MARSANRCTQEGDSRVSVPSERAEARDFAEPRELSLEEVLKSYEQPINEEQAWAVCYQCCSWLRVPRLNRSEDITIYQVKDPSSIFLHRDGTVSLHPEIWNSNGNNTNFLIALITHQLKDMFASLAHSCNVTVCPLTCLVLGVFFIRSPS